MQLTHAHTATAGVSPHVHFTCTSYVLYAYLYCVYALVGGAISIRDPYICANESHAVFHRPVVCAMKTGSCKVDGTAHYAEDYETQRIYVTC